ncbi:hypothetical protein [Candidatus Chlorohelix sp.]|uniref:hypothetical protein n=1 Tax=Candidatus Chlorohelix sp. TaxID=3139201 RepID=UPI00306DF0AE
MRTYNCLYFSAGFYQFSRQRFSHYYNAAKSLREGYNPYNQVANPSNVPLWVAIPYLWLIIWQYNTALIIWTALNVPFMVGVVWLGAKLTGLKTEWRFWPMLFLVGLILRVMPTLLFQGWLDI